MAISNSYVSHYQRVTHLPIFRWLLHPLMTHSEVPPWVGQSTWGEVNFGLGGIHQHSWNMSTAIIMDISFWIFNMDILICHSGYSIWLYGYILMEKNMEKSNPIIVDDYGYIILDIQYCCMDISLWRRIWMYRYIMIDIQHGYIDISLWIFKMDVWIYSYGEEYGYIDIS